MENNITIFMGIASILGTILTVLLAFSSYQQDKMENNLENILVRLSDLHPEYNCYPKDFNHELQVCNIKSDIDKYTSEYNGLKIFKSKLKWINISYKTLCMIMILFIYNSYTLVNLDIVKLLTSLIVTLLCFIIFWKLIDLLIPYNNSTKGNYPTPQELTNANLIIFPNTYRINSDLPIKLFVASTSMAIYDTKSKTHNPFSNEFEMQKNVNFDKCKSMARLALPVEFKFNFTIKFILKDDNKISFKINDKQVFKSKFSNIDSIFFNLPFLSEDLFQIYIYMKPTNDDTKDYNYIAMYGFIKGHIICRQDRMVGVFIKSKNHASVCIENEAPTFLTPQELLNDKSF